MGSVAFMLVMGVSTGHSSVCAVGLLKAVFTAGAFELVVAGVFSGLSSILVGLFAAGVVVDSSLFVYAASFCFVRL